jgi:hypothetical protein
LVGIQNTFNHVIHRNSKISGLQLSQCTTSDFGRRCVRKSRDDVPAYRRQRTASPCAGRLRNLWVERTLGELWLYWLNRWRSRAAFSSFCISAVGRTSWRDFRALAASHKCLFSEASPAPSRPLTMSQHLKPRTRQANALGTPTRSPTKLRRGMTLSQACFHVSLSAAYPQHTTGPILGMR